MNGATQLGLILLISACSADASLPADLEFKHGIAFFQDLKYPTDFTHFDYLNPDAPKGGKLVLAHPFSFNTLAPMPQGETGAPSKGLLNEVLPKIRGKSAYENQEYCFSHLNECDLILSESQIADIKQCA